MKYKSPQKRRPTTERRYKPATSFFFPEKFIAATPAHIHTDEKAAQMADAFNARAFTYNNHVFFNKNEYQPHTTDGKKLLVHELAHVRQARPVIARQPKPGKAEISPQQKAAIEAAEKAALAKTKADLHAQKVLWDDIHNFFPDDARKLAGTGNDDSVDYLDTSFKEGDETSGSIIIHHSAPVIKVGTKYAAEPDVAKRKSAIQAEIEKIDTWRYDTWRIDDKDLTNATITGKLSALDLTKKQAYITGLQTKEKTIANKAMQEFIRKQMPSTPVSAGATPTAGGGFSFQFDNVTINVLTDVFDSADVKENGGETKLTPVSGSSFPGSPAWRSKNGIVTSITNPPAKVFPVWTVQTFYGKKADPAGPSGYGYGTRPQDTAPGGNSTLRFHEGSHGTEFIEYIRSHIAATPYPNYTGAVGDTEAVINKKDSDYTTARDAFKKTLEDAKKTSTEKIDCAGKSIVKYSSEHGETTTVKCP